MISPFKFLDSYDKNDKNRFFGRDRETAQLYNAVFASNLTLLYGGSGTGKTSLINCGLANKFYDTDWQPIFVRRGNDFNTSLDAALRKAMKNPTADFDEETIEAKIESVYRDSYRPVFLIFDQFEELFVLGKTDEARAFYKTIRHILDSKYSKIKAKIIISIREEWVGYLHEFEKEIPYLFDNRVRVERMNDRNLFQVVGGTLKAANIGIEDPSVTIALILDNIRDKKLGVDLTNLQVYLDRVFRKAIERDSKLEDSKFQISNSNEGGDSKFQISNSNAANFNAELNSNSSSLIGTNSNSELNNNSQSKVEAPSEIRNPKSEITFSPSVVKEVGAMDNVISLFLDEQFTGIESGLAQRGIKKTKGMTLEILFTMISNDGTKRQVKVNGILENLPKSIVLTADDIGFCLIEFKRIRILREMDTEYELSHDSIAKQISEKASDDAKNRRKVETLLQQAMDLYAKRKTLLSADQLDEIKPFNNILRLNEAETVFIDKSKKAIRLKQVLRAALVLSIMAILTIATLISIRMAKRATEGEQKAKAQKFLVMAKQACDQKNYSDAIAFANQSLALQPNDSEALRILGEAYHINYSNYAPLSINSLQLDSAAVVQPVFSPKGDYLIAFSKTNTAVAYGFTRDSEGIFSRKMIPLSKNVDVNFKPVFNEEGDQILLYNTDSTLVLMDTTGKTLNILRGHTDLVSQAFYSKNNQCWVTCGLDGLVVVWDKTGQPLHTIRHTKGWIKQMRLNTAETEIATWNTEGGGKDSVEVQEFPLGKRKYRFLQPESFVEDLAFDASNKQIVTFSHGKFWYWKNGQKQKDILFVGNYDNDTKAHFNPTGSAFFSKDKDRSLRVQRELNLYKGYGEAGGPKYFSSTGYEVIEATWSPEGDKIAILTGGETIEIQDIKGNVLARLTHEGATDAAFSADGKQLVTTDARGLLKFWSTQAAEPLVLDFQKNILNLEFTPKSDKLLLCLNDTLARFADFKGNLIQELPNTKGVSRSQYSNDGQKFLLTAQNRIHLFNADGQALTAPILFQESINSASFFNGSNHFLTTTNEELAVFWHLKDSLLRGDSIKEKIYMFDISLDNKQLLTFGWLDSMTIKTRQIDGTGTKIIGQYPDWKQVYEVKFLPDNRHFLVYTEGGELYRLAENEAPEKMLNGAKIGRLWVSNDRKLMVTIMNSTLQLRTTEGALIQVLKQARGTNGFLSNIAFSPDGKRIALVYDSGKVVFWWTPNAVLERIHAKKQFELTVAEKIKYGVNYE